MATENSQEPIVADMLTMPVALFWKARLCAKHQPQRVHPPQTLRLVLWTQSRSDQNENCCQRSVDH